MHGKTPAIIVAAMLSGCAAMQQAKQREAIEAAQQYCRLMLADPALDPIRSKVALDNPTNQTFAMRTDTSRATEQEKPALGMWVDMRRECRTETIRKVPMPAQAVAVLNAAAQATDSLTAQLYLGEITYGEFADRRAKINAELEIAYANIDNASRIQNQQAAFHTQALVSQTIANWNALMQTQAIQQMQFQMSQPHTINCQTFGNTTQCH
jgi:hypothetical protein